MERFEVTLDANDTNSVTPPINMLGAEKVSLHVIGLSGTHAAHVIELQKGNEDPDADTPDWQNSGSSITGTGFLDNVDTVAAHVRAKVNTPEGAASTVKAILVAK